MMKKLVNRMNGVCLMIGLAAMLVNSAPAASLSEGEGWVDLFNGKSLDGWIQRNGKAKYRVEDGQIVGETVPNTGNSFLCTDKDFGDFMLEMEFKVDSRMNAGIQFRSQSLPDYNNGQVHGYQFEIDPSPRAWTGGVYDEGRRGWLNNLKENDSAREAFRQNQWNKVRIKAVGDSIKTWINDVPAADLKDSMTLKGFVGLQVHGVGRRKETMEIRWRNIRLKELHPGGQDTISLFDGRSLDGWVTGDGKPVSSGWEAVEGVLHRKSGGGNIYSAKEYDDFDLTFDWKISSGGNSGVKYRVIRYGNSLLGPEYQVLDDDKHPDAQQRQGRRKASALYDLYVCHQDKQLSPVGEWNQARIVARGSQVEHWLNGVKVVAYDTASDDWKNRVAGSKFSGVTHFGENLRGKFMLQDHGDEVWYRNMVLRPLN